MKSKNGLLYLLVAGEIAILALVLLLGVTKQIRGPRAPKDREVTAQHREDETWQPEGQTPSQEGVGEPDTEGTPENGQPGEDGQEADGQETPPPEEAGQPEEEEQREEFSEEVEAVLAAMTVEQKVAQVFLVSPETLTNNDRVTIAGSGTRSALQSYPVGGLLYGSGNFMGIAQMRELITKAQDMSLELSGQYLFAGMVVEQEGGAVIAAARSGQEERLGALLDPRDTLDPAVAAEFLQLPLYQELGQLPAAPNPAPGVAGITCYRVGADGQDAVQALQGGADMLCVTEGFAEVYQSVLDAVNAQEISQMALDQAVGRILTGKQEISGQAGGQ